MNQIILGKGHFGYIKGHLFWQTGHLDSLGGQLLVTPCLMGSCFWHFQYKLRTNFFLKKVFYNEASDPWTLYLSEIGPEYTFNIYLKII